MTNLVHLTISEARKKLLSKEIKASELTEAYIKEIQQSNSSLNAYVVVTEEKARSMAKDCDDRLADKKGRLLEGIPLGIKDNFATKDIHTQACSHILDGFKPLYESTVTSNLWADGAVMLGKMNMDEFAMGSSNENSYYGPVINPWRIKKQSVDDDASHDMHEKKEDLENSGAFFVPGGSSGGSASGVAACLCAGATGTDTGGSIRQPAAFTGTVGIKPTYGRCSRFGIIAFASSLDQAGPIARDVRDAAILLESMASVDEKDSTSVNRPVPNYELAIGKSIKGMKIGIPKEYSVEGMPKEIEYLWEKGISWLKDAGAQVSSISLAHTRYALPAYYIVAPAEASSNFARYDGVRYGLRSCNSDIHNMYEKTRAEGFGNEVKRRIMIGSYVLSAGHAESYYIKAQKIRTLIKKDFDSAFDAGIDMILVPTTPSGAFALSNEKKESDPVKMYLNDIFTVTVNMAGLPGISVPAGLDYQGLPLGLQLIGRPFDEETMFRVAHVIEKSAGIFKPQRWW